MPQYDITASRGTVPGVGPAATHCVPVQTYKYLRTPCRSMTLLHRATLCLALVLALPPGDSTDEGGCLFYRRHDNRVCAQRCIAPFVGPCPRFVPVRIGLLEEGRCADVGYPFFLHNMSIFAGPCGLMEFSMFSGIERRSLARNEIPAPYLPAGVLVPRVLGAPASRWPRFRGFPHQASVKVA